LFVLCCSSAFVLGAQNPRAVATATPSQVQVHVLGTTLLIHENWYDDVFIHAVGDEFIPKEGEAMTAKQRGDTKKVRLRCTRSKENNTLDVVLGSIQGYRYSGDELRFHFEHDASGAAQVRMTGNWKSDMKRGDKPSDGVLDDIRGDVYVSSSDFGNESPLSIKFAVTTSWSTVPSVLMGGLVIP
jgi:hypothetical protein